MNWYGSIRLSQVKRWKNKSSTLNIEVCLNNGRISDSADREYPEIVKQELMPLFKTNCLELSVEISSSGHQDSEVLNGPNPYPPESSDERSVGQVKILDNGQLVGILSKEATLWMEELFFAEIKELEIDTSKEF